MNKTKKSALGAAGVGVVALAMLGGGTFATWTDFATITGNETEAGHLVLDLKSTGVISNVGHLAIAPGEHRTTDYFVASADMDGVPDAGLSFTVRNLADQENGCSSGSEREAEEAACDSSTDVGEFSENATVGVLYTEPTTGLYVENERCRDATGKPLPNSAFGSRTEYTLADMVGAKNSLGNLTPGQGICVRVGIGLPSDAENDTQGDSATFDIQWDLEQII